MKRLVVVADNSLIVEAIRIGLRTSGEFDLLGHANGRRTSARTIVDAAPDLRSMVIAGSLPRDESLLAS